jgi:hypothetical protein
LATAAQTVTMAAAARRTMIGEPACPGPDRNVADRHDRYDQREGDEPEPPVGGLRVRRHVDTTFRDNHLASCAAVKHRPTAGYLTTR